MNTKAIYMKIGLLTILAIWSTSISYSQEKSTQEWDLSQCLSYALEHNIQVNQKKLDVINSEAGLLKAKSERLPNLNASLSESVTNSKNQTLGSSGSWGINGGTSASITSNLPIYSGGAISNTIKQSQLNVDIANLNIEVTKNDITLSITQAYLNVLFAKETVDYAKEVVLSSQKQVERARALIKAGSIAKTDLAQLEAQFASDQYTLVVAQNTLISNTTSLKQLLEIPVTDTFKVKSPDIDFDKEYTVLPPINDAFDTSISIMPEIKSSQLSKSVAEYNIKIARSGYLPSLSLNASYSTNFTGQNTTSFNSQFADNQRQSLGFTLNIPIFSRNVVKTAIQQYQIGFEQADLTLQQTKKTLLQSVESIYQSSISEKSRYDAALVQFSSANESYNLSEGQYNLGMLNSFDLLKAKNTLLNAKKELINSKYSAILNRKILDFYMGKTISL